MENVVEMENRRNSGRASNNSDYHREETLLREGADAVDFRTQTKIMIYSFNFKNPSRFNFVS